MFLRPSRSLFVGLFVLFLFSWHEWRSSTSRDFVRTTWRNYHEVQQGVSVTAKEAVTAGHSRPDAFAQSETQEGLVKADKEAVTAVVSKLDTNTHSKEQNGVLKIDKKPVASTAPKSDLIAASNHSDGTVVTNETAVAKPTEPSPYAYVFYATDDTYACSVLINVDRLQNLLHTHHRIFVIAAPNLSEQYVKEFEMHNVTVSIQQPPPLAEGGADYYRDCLLKLMAFKMHHIDPSLKRIIMLDSDQLIMKNLDDLFEDLPEADLAAPRAYWISRQTLSSTFMMITLSERLWNMVEKGLQEIGFDKYDMDLINEILGDTVMMLPGTYVTLNSHWEDWNLPKWYHKPETRGNITVYAASPLADEKPVKIAASSRVSHPSASHKQASAHKHDRRNAAPEPQHASHDFHNPVSSIPKPSPVNLLPNSSPKGQVEPENDSGLSHPSTQLDDSYRNSDSDTDAPAIFTPVPPAIPDTSYFSTPAPKPRPEDRPLYHELIDLYPAASVLHFFALGKPWTYSVADVRLQRPDAHPVFEAQFRTWRSKAKELCWGVVDVV